VIAFFVPEVVQPARPLDIDPARRDLHLTPRDHTKTSAPARRNAGRTERNRSPKVATAT